MTNRDHLKTAILELAKANNDDDEDHAKLVDSLIDTAIQGEIGNKIDPTAYPPLAFIECFTKAARRETTGEIPNETEFYLPLIVYGIHKSKMLLGSQCYFCGEFVSLFLPNLGVGIFVDDESRFYEVTDSLVTFFDDNGEMDEPENYSENSEK